MLIKKTKALSRRTLLKSTAVCLGLPLLEAMYTSSSAFASGEGIPQRLFFIFCPNGHLVKPLRDTGPGFTPSPFLAPLQEAGVWEDVKAMVTNIQLHPGVRNAHPRESASYLTCFNLDFSQEELTNRTSVDQVFADHKRDGTFLKSLEIGIDDGKRGSCDGGASCVYNNTISWRGNVPNKIIPDAQKALAILLGVSDTVESTIGHAQVTERSASLLDFVRIEANELSAKLGDDDKKRLDDYLSAVRDLELVIQQDKKLNCSELILEGDKTHHPTNVRQQLEVAALAFRCDATRVGSFMFGAGGSNRPLDFLGFANHHHGVATNDRRPGGGFYKMSIWEGEQFAYFLKLLKDIPEASGNLLDNTMVQYGSGLSDHHTVDNLTMVYAGNGGNMQKLGKVDANYKKLEGVYVDLLQSMDVPIDQFGGEGPAGILGA